MLISISPQCCQLKLGCSKVRFSQTQFRSDLYKLQHCHTLDSGLAAPPSSLMSASSAGQGRRCARPHKQQVSPPHLAPQGVVVTTPSLLEEAKAYENHGDLGGGGEASSKQKPCLLPGAA